jgi:thiol-disulfide isomerase/thioredoxin
MKKLKWLLPLLLGILIIQPISAQKVKYDISGTFAGNAGKKVYLSKNKENLQAIDSATIKADNTFRMTGTLNSVSRYWFNFNKGKFTPIFLDGAPMNISIDAKGKITIKSDNEQKVLRESEDKVVQYCFVRLAAMFAISRAKDKGNQAHLDTVYTAMDSLTKAVEKSLNSYVDSVSNNITAPYFIEDYFIHYKSYDEAMNAYNRLTNRVKQSAPGLKLKAQLEEMSQYVVGGTAPNFTSTTPAGKKFSLYSLRGHIVLLDFWASWCGPCMREMPNVKSLYEKYHSKGLEVLGVSLDRERAPWVKTIKDKGLIWHQVSALKEFEDPVAKRFHVTAIPRMYIINEKGKIIAQDLRGEDLAKKMAELFANK